MNAVQKLSRIALVSREPERLAVIEYLKTL